MTTFDWILTIALAIPLYAFGGSLHWSLGRRRRWYGANPLHRNSHEDNDPLSIATIFWPLSTVLRLVLLVLFTGCRSLDRMIVKFNRVTEYIVDWPDRRRAQKSVPEARVVDR